MTQAWYPDPGRQHQYRYWDGQVWTDHVSDNGVSAVDPLPPPPEDQPTLSERMHQAHEWSDQRMRDAAAAMYRRNAHHQGRAVPVLNPMDSVSVLGPVVRRGRRREQLRRVGERAGGRAAGTARVDGQQ